MLARGDVVAIMFGFNGDNLLLTGTGNSLQQGSCVNGAGQSLFTQVAYCNSPAFYRAANRDIARGLLKIPALGTGNDGQACPTVRGFDVVDQDQSDNVVTTYLINAQGQTAQDSAANVAGLPGVTAINNGSDNALVNKFMDPALGCTPYEFHDKTAAAGKSGSQITDELLAAADQAAPVALVPLNDPMTQVNGAQSMLKTNLFRLGVDQPMVSAAQTGGHPGELLQEHDAGRDGPGGAGREAVQRVRHPRGGQGNNLFTFLAARLSASWGNLGCGALLNAPDPVNLTLDANGVATAATFSPLAIGTLPGGVAPTATPASAGQPRLHRPRPPRPRHRAAPRADGDRHADGTPTGGGRPRSRPPPRPPRRPRRRGWHNPDRAAAPHVIRHSPGGQSREERVAGVPRDTGHPFPTRRAGRPGRRSRRPRSCTAGPAPGWPGGWGRGRRAGARRPWPGPGRRRR